MANTIDLEEVDSLSSVTVRPVVSSKDYKHFIDFHYDLCASYPKWVPQLRMEVKKLLDTKKHPFYEHGKIQPFLAFNEQGKVVGRVAAIVNGMHLKKYQDNTGFFGFFDCLEDYTIAQSLLDRASEWLREQGLTHVRGPANPSMNDIAGLLVDGFQYIPSIMMPYNPRYYYDYLTKYGFERAMTMWAYYIHYKYTNTEKLERGVNLLYRRYPTLKMRHLDMKRFEEDAQHILDIYNDAWSENWGHVPMTKPEFKHLANDLKQVVDPKIVFILEDDGYPVAFSLTLPNINLALQNARSGRLLPNALPQLLLRGKFGGIHEGRTLLMGVRKSHQGKGLDAILNLTVIKDLPEDGYYASEMSWVLDSNKPMMNAMEHMGGTPEKEYVMLEKEL